MKIPYAMVAAVDNYKRHAQMGVASLHYKFPRLKQLPIDDSKILTIACYGPSLQDTWQTMQHPIMSMSGATKWLAERGLFPDYHVDMDPRPNKVDDVTPAFKEVEYIMASVCHPDVFRALDGFNVTLWHVYSSDETYKLVAAIDPDQHVIRGGSTIGLTALHVAGIMGYRHFEIHGMDGSFKDLDRAVRHAGPHTGHKQNKDGITWKSNGKVYATSKIMSNAVAETLNTMRDYPMFCVFHGEGLTQSLVRENNFANACCADETEKADRIRRMTAQIIGPAMDGGMSMAAWDALTGAASGELQMEMTLIHQANEERRAKAKYNTGSITVEQMVQLRQLTMKLRPQTIVEIGTFIGNSAMSMIADKIYTCDRDNDCFPRTETVQVHPGMQSTEMLRILVDRHIKADMFFFDGRIQLPDLPLILRLTHPGSVFVFDDYRGNEKGIANVSLLAPMLPEDRMLVTPDFRLAGKSTLAMLVPTQMFKRAAA